MEQRIFTILDSNRFKLSKHFLINYIHKQPKWGPIGYITYLRTYSRPLTDDQRNFALKYFNLKYAKETTEQYWQTCQRVVEGVWSIFKQRVNEACNPWDEKEAQEKAQDMFERMWAFKFLPPGRGLWFMGTLALELRGAGALNNCGFCSTQNIDKNFSHPFVTLMDFLMLGVGMGFDVRGNKKVTLLNPIYSQDTYVIEDSREGWCNSVKILLDSYVGKNTIPTFNFSQIRAEGLPLKTFGGTSSGPQPLIDLLESIQKILNNKIGQFLTSTDIVDLMNYIGKCVVAGNVRRSSEIALGEEDDFEFLNLKNRDDLDRITSEKATIEQLYLETDPVYFQHVNKITDYLEHQSNYNVLDNEYLELQISIDQSRKILNDILITNSDYQKLVLEEKAHPLFTHRWASNNSLFSNRFTNFKKTSKATVKNGEPNYLFLENIHRGGRLIDPPDDKDIFVLGCNPCGEQPLEDNELCCLVETFPTNHESLEDYLATLKVAFQYAKCVTLVPTHLPATNAVITRNRRIGSSMAGIWEMYEQKGMQTCIEWWDAGFKEICKWDKTYSHWLGVPESNRHTTVKPGGTVPLLVGKEGGMKLPISKFYFRTIRVDRLHPLIEACRNAGYRVEEDLTTPRTMVIYFPIKDMSENVRTSSEVSIWEQVALLVALQTYWSDNMVSATITFKPEEANQIEKILEIYSNQLKCICFLPLNTHGYLQAPYIPCTEKEYLAAVNTLQPFEINDVNVHQMEDKYCEGDFCLRPE